MQVLTKVCTGCNKEKSLEDFAKHKLGKYGKDPMCKSCRGVYFKEYLKNNKEKRKLTLQKYNNTESARLCRRRYQERNREEINRRKRVFREENPEIVALCRKKYNDANKDKARKYRQDNRELLNASQRKRMLIPKERIRHRMGRAIRRSLAESKAGMPWEALVGYTVD